MTQEQFDRAVEINNRLNELEEVKKEIECVTERSLSFIRMKSYGDYEPCSEYIMRYIGELLDKHDTMIRQEIDEEIENLKKEIETL